MQIISRQRAKSHYEATRHQGDIVAKIVAWGFSPRVYGSVNEREKEGGKGGKERRKERKSTDSKERYVPAGTRDGSAARFESGSSMFAFNIYLTFSPCMYALRDARNVRYYSRARFAKYFHARWHLDGAPKIRD